ncbi:MAG: hypothetical protein LBD53_09940 [Tannerella sp.]|jgi:hypothetical protein|nr:hypothetical protein [Tannerella sp.]
MRQGDEETRKQGDEETRRQGDKGTRTRFYFLLGVLTVISIVLLFLLQNEKFKNKQYATYLEAHRNDSLDINLILANRSIEIGLSGMKLDSIVSLSDGKGNICKLEDVIDRDKFTLVFSDACCDDCVNAEIEKISNRENQLDSLNTMIWIIAEHSPRYVAQYKFNNRHRIKFPIYKMQPLKEDLFPIHVPYFLVVEKETGRTNCVYLPNKYKPDRTENYLTKIIDDFFTQ